MINITLNWPFICFRVQDLSSSKKRKTNKVMYPSDLRAYEPTYFKVKAAKSTQVLEDVCTASCLPRLPRILSFMIGRRAGSLKATNTVRVLCASSMDCLVYPRQGCLALLPDSSFLQQYSYIKQIRTSSYFKIGLKKSSRLKTRVVCGRPIAIIIHVKFVPGPAGLFLNVSISRR